MLNNSYKIDIRKTMFLTDKLLINFLYVMYINFLIKKVLL